MFSKQTSLHVMLSILFFLSCSRKDTIFRTRLFPISNGWAKTSVNAVIFRRNSLVTHNNFQYAAFYDENANVILAKRHIDSSNWQVQKTPYKGNVKDAHNAISIMIDGDGYLHMAWDHHNDSLRYCMSRDPEFLDLTGKKSMTGIKEQQVTYPEFYKMPDGNLLFLYRDGASGRGNLLMNYYDRHTQSWSKLQENLIDGEGERNAYWQATVDQQGMIHLSWVWRETADVETNHDLCYAQSPDNGKSWTKSTGEAYDLPITQKSAEYIRRIPQGSGLSNQTSMCADADGFPYIAAIWRPRGDVPQYHIVYFDGRSWQTIQATQRTQAFHLSGGGTKRLPMSRPQIVVDDNKTVFLIYRDSERGNCVSMARNRDLTKNSWIFENLTSFSVGMWEPSYDTEMWRERQKLHLFVQKVGQGDGEQMEEMEPQMVSVLEIESGE